MRTKTASNTKFGKSKILQGKKIAIVALDVMFLLPGIILDCVYWGYFKCSFLKGIVNDMRGWSAWGITYNGALHILENNVGVLLTMVSLFLTMGINIAERSEKKVYGILRKELPQINGRGGYHCVHKINYVAPVLMLIFLNFSFCVSGYLLFFYCYYFLVRYFLSHERSYSKEENCKAAAAKLANYITTKSDDIRLDDLQQYKIQLESVGRSIEDDGDWQNAEELFSKLIEKVSEDGVEKKFLVCLYFYKIVYWKRSKRNSTACLQVLKNKIMEADILSVEGTCFEEQLWPVLWAMFKVVVMEAEEIELEDLFRWMLNYVRREQAVVNHTEKSLSYEVIAEETGMVLVLMEQRIRSKSLESILLVEQLRVLWDNGKRAFLDDGTKFRRWIRYLADKQMEENDTALVKIIRDLEDDYSVHSRKCAVSNIVFMKWENQNEY